MWLPLLHLEHTAANSNSLQKILFDELDGSSQMPSPHYLSIYIIKLYN